MIAIVGATATGKTALGVELAGIVDGEVISVDSRQVYRQMDIGTAKPSSAQRAAVPHHGLDLVKPDQRFSAGEFARRARGWIAEITGRGRVPLLVGGTGFFLRALTHPIFREPPLQPERRAALAGLLEGWSTDELRRWAQVLDPAGLRRLSGGGDRQRLMRTLEVALLSGRTLAWWQQHSQPEAPPLRPLIFVLEMAPERLRGAIDARVGDMARAGLPDEVRALVAAGFGETAPGMNATGYVELLPWVRGEIALESALDQVRRNTRAYARRQRTWFRHQLPSGAESLDATRPSEKLAAHIARRWKEVHP